MLGCGNSWFLFTKELFKGYCLLCLLIELLFAKHLWAIASQRCGYHIKSSRKYTVLLHDLKNIPYDVQGKHTVYCHMPQNVQADCSGTKLLVYFNQLVLSFSQFSRINAISFAGVELFSMLPSSVASPNQLKPNSRFYGSINLKSKTEHTYGHIDYFCRKAQEQQIVLSVCR